MIEITPTLREDYPRAFALARQDRMRVVWLEEDLVYVARRKRGHDQYLVRFFVAERMNREPQVKVRCNTITGARCRGTEFNECCSHIAAVVLRSQMKYGRKKQRKEAA